MAKQSGSEKLDKVVERMLGRADARTPRAEPARPPDAKPGSAAEVIFDLRGLPRSEFRARLKVDLERRATMASSAKGVSEFRNTATPYLSIKGAAAAIEFYKKAFGATEAPDSRFVQPDGRVGHAEINIGGARIMLADEFPEIGFRSPESLGGSPIHIHLDVADVDAFARRAVAAGAKVVRPVADQFYGDRSGQVSDPFGYTWAISTRKEAVSPEEMQRRFAATTRQTAETAATEAARTVNPVREGFHSITPYLVVSGAGKWIDFVKKVFGAEERLRVPRPGTDIVMHAEVRIGDSMVEVADANPQYPAMPVTLLVRVSDPDAVYNRAVEAGATPLEPISDKDYGSRGGTVVDLAGNRLHISKPTGGGVEIFKDFRSVTPHLYAAEPEDLIEFLKQAFGGEEIYRAQMPDGSIPHAQVRLGDSVVALAGAQGPYTLMPCTLHLYVPDVDAVYSQALRAGAVSIQAPADQPYGDRSGGVTDRFGNRWFIATHVRDVSG